MNAVTAIWTLWIASFPTTGGGSTVVTPLATYASHQECLNAYNSIVTDLGKAYPNAGGPGIMFCVYGMPVKK